MGVTCPVRWKTLPGSLGLLGVVLITSVPAAGQFPDTVALEAHARFLSHDLLEGRAPGSRGEQLAGLYLASRLREAGVGPLVGDDYRLPVPLTAVSFEDQGAVVRLTTGDRTRSLRPPDFYHPGGSGTAFRNFSGELVLVGSAAGAIERLPSGLDLDGAVVVLTPPWAGVGAVEAELARRGASGTIQLVPHPHFYERLRIVRGPTRYFLPDGVDDPDNQSGLPSVVGGIAMIRALGLTGDEVASGTLADPRHLDARIDVRLPHDRRPVIGFNVAGAIRGDSETLRDEWVVVVAHYDHVGVGQPTEGDSIWNGFIDNAAGSAMVLEIAAAMAADPPARSVAFVFVTAEEQGLLGSNWFVHESAIRPDHIRAVLNLDGGAPPAPPTAWGLVGAETGEATARARDIIERHGWSVNRVDPGPQSDHWPFHRAGVPALLLFPGDSLEGLTDEESAALRARWIHPHTPDDEWHADFPFSGLERYAALALEIGRTLAEHDFSPD